MSLKKDYLGITKLDEGYEDAKENAY